MSPFKLNLFLKVYTLAKLPLLAFISPKVIELTDKTSVVRVPLGYRTRNHLNVMYFGALAMGAELSIAAKAVQAIQESGKKIDFIFKDFKCEFLKRADGDVHFICDEADGVQSLITQSTESPDRLEKKFIGYAIVPKRGSDPIMKYELTLSVKNRSLKVT